MTTKIYQTYAEFQNRKKQDENGVSPEFAANNPQFQAQNTSNEKCWNCSDCHNCRDCSDCHNCRDCSGCRYCSYCSDCRYCSYCSDCRYCSDCSDCSGCRYCHNCSGCRYCSDCSEKKDDQGSGMPKIPVVENIHSKILDAVTATGKLEMEAWHTCATTHCRGGWAIQLAGKPGLDLERATDQEFAAMMIFKASSPVRVSPVRFYESNEVAMADIERCALEEKNLQQS